MRTTSDTRDPGGEEVDESKGLFLSHKGKIGVILCKNGREFFDASGTLGGKGEGVARLLVRWRSGLGLARRMSD